jgi:hypothetical protein
MKRAARRSKEAAGDRDKEAWEDDDERHRDEPRRDGNSAS